ncbi:hypothetical protein [Pedobacter alluvionis]|uniref:hypothetical protein n=1 Tax=Pedobacter alluvionis TaxID=475253 RepID=UPI001ABC2D8B|nr:hypothetical protein [Pedobacter alluvionis]
MKHSASNSFSSYPRLNLEDKKPVVPVNGVEGLKDLKIIDAIYEAVKTGKQVKLTA